MKKFYLLLAVISFSICSMTGSVTYTDDLGFILQLNEEKSSPDLLSLDVFWFNESNMPVRDLMVTITSPEGAEWAEPNGDLFDFEDNLATWGVNRASQLNFGVAVSGRSDVKALYGEQTLAFIGAHCNKNYLHMNDFTKAEPGKLGTCWLNISNLPDGNYEMMIPGKDFLNVCATNDAAQSFTPNEASVVTFSKFGATVKAKNVDVTGVEQLNTNKSVTAVKYYNVAGLESSEPFDGLNIVVKTYTDGTRSAEKMLK